MTDAEGRDTRTRAEAAFQRWLDGFRGGGESEGLAEELLSNESVDTREEVRRMIADYHALRGRIGEGTPAFEPGRVLGDFRLVRELGRGGMAVVWEAEQLSLARKVALKLLLPHFTLSANALARFEREARAGGRLAHPGIVQTHAVGKAEGQHYIVQELVGGGYTLADSLADLREERELPDGYYRSVAELFAKVADALAYAHGQGVIHRDVKPSNILIDEEDEPNVVDFGLARIQDEISLSRTGELEGTPCYMSPEQAAAKSMGIDHRTDVFSLGSTLYEALTLTRAFDGDTSQLVFRKILTVDPPDPRTIRSKVPRDLAVICLKAMEKNPERRYATMAAFAADLRSWLTGCPIEARPISSIEKGLRWTRRHPVSTLGAVSAFVLAIVIGGLGSYSVSAGNRAAVERRARLAEAELRARSETERERLQQAEADRRLRERLLDLLAVLPLQGNRLDWQTSAGWYLEAYREFGLPLDDGRSIADLASGIDAVEVRDPDLGYEVVQGIHGLRGVLEWTVLGSFLELRGSGSVEKSKAAPEEKVRAGLDQAGSAWLDLWKRLIALIDSLEGRDPWRSTVWNACKEYLASGTYAFGPLLEPDSLKGRSGRDLAWAARLSLEAWVSDSLVSDPLLNLHGTDSWIELYDRALEIGPDDPSHLYTCYVERGMASFLQANSTQAVHDLEIAAAIRPNSAFTQLFLSLAYKLAKSPKAQERAARKATEREPGLALAWLMLGDACYWNQDYDGALLASRKAAELEPASGDPMKLIGDALQAKGDLDAAIVAYQHCIELDPANMSLYNYLAHAVAAQFKRFQGTGDREGARLLLRETIGRLERILGQTSPWGQNIAAVLESIVALESIVEELERSRDQEGFKDAERCTLRGLQSIEATEALASDIVPWLDLLVRIYEASGQLDKRNEYQLRRASVLRDSGLDSPKNLDFEIGEVEACPFGWFVPTRGYSASLSDEDPFSGNRCGVLSAPGNPSGFGNLMQSFDAAPSRSRKFAFRAAVRVEGDARTRAQLWFRVDRPSGAIGFFDNMDDRPIRSSAWAEYEISGTIDENAQWINFGMMLMGPGKAWIDSASFVVRE